MHSRRHCIIIKVFFPLASCEFSLKVNFSICFVFIHISTVIQLNDTSDNLKLHLKNTHSVLSRDQNGSLNSTQGPYY